MQKISCSLFENSVCLAVTITKFCVNRKGDKSKITTDAKATMVHLGKKLIDSPELEQIAQLDSVIYQFLSADRGGGQRSLPFQFKKGVYLIPSGLFKEVESRLKAYFAVREILINNFISLYLQRVKEAQEQLCSLYNENEYPTIEQVRAKFSFTWTTFRIEVAESLKVQSQEIFDQEKNKIEKLWENAGEEIVQILRGEALYYINGLLSKLQPTKKGEVKEIPENYLERLKDFFEIFQKRNICDDQELAQVVEIAKQAVSGVNSFDLQNNEALRAKVKQEFEAAAIVFDVMEDDAHYDSYDSANDYELYEDLLPLMAAAAN